MRQGVEAVLADAGATWVILVRAGDGSSAAYGPSPSLDDPRVRGTGKPKVSGASCRRMIPARMVAAGTPGLWSHSGRMIPACVRRKAAAGLADDQPGIGSRGGVSFGLNDAAYFRNFYVHAEQETSGVPHRPFSPEYPRACGARIQTLGRRQKHTGISTRARSKALHKESAARL